jgi:hypothetical protein
MLHIILGCYFAHQVWDLVFNRFQLISRANMQNAVSLAEWWSVQVVAMPKEKRKI